MNSYWIKHVFGRIGFCKILHRSPYVSPSFFVYWPTYSDQPYEGVTKETKDNSNNDMILTTLFSL